MRAIAYLFPTPPAAEEVAHVIVSSGWVTEDCGLAGSVLQRLCRGSIAAPGAPPA